MEQLRQFWDNFSLRQRLGLGVVLVAVLGGLYGFTRFQKEKNFRPLFTQLAPEDAGTLTAKLREKTVEYRVSEDGTTISVPSEKLAELRLELASEGLPRTGRLGFELFDQTNFGLTEFAEKINYQRALEGELERTISSLREVERARVHLTLAKKSVFEAERKPAKASVVLNLRAGAKLAPATVQAITYMLASAVDELSPEHISLLDQAGNLLSRPRKQWGPDEEMPEMVLEYRQKLEKGLLAKVHETLIPLLGEEGYRAGLTADVDMTSGESSEEVYDPDKAVVLTEQKTEDVTGIASSGGAPGTPTNLPRPVSRPVSGSSGAQRTTESTTYQTSRTIRRMKLPQGTLKRLSVSVLLDQPVRWEGVGPKAKRIFDAPTPEKIQTIKGVLSAAVGLVPERGDQIIIESLPFDASLKATPPAAPTPPAPPKPVIEIPAFLLPYLPAPLKDPNLLLAALVGAGLVVFLLLVAVFWLLRRKQGKKVTVAEGDKALAAGDQASLPPAEPGDTRSFEERLAEQQELQKRLEQSELEKLKMPHVTTQKGKILAQHITDEAKKDPMMIAHILRSWLHED
ncbi:MAG: flagellar basal-body MS-ring/collar protein FliF [Bryobacter sp.]|nr:flagellar basal-body MS-ring/collar protein FliF [Bryobacter sp.]